MSEAIQGPFYTVPWCPGMEKLEMPGSLWAEVSARADELRRCASPRVLRTAITMRSTEGALFGSPIDQLAAYLGLFASSGPGLKRTTGASATDRVAV